MRSSAAEQVSGSATRAGLLITHPIQYFAPGLRLLSARSDLRLCVYYWDAAAEGLPDPEFGQHIRWDTDLHTGYRWWSPPAVSRWRRRLAMLRALRRDRPHVLLSFGWRHPPTVLGILYAMVSRTPIVYYGDSHPDFAAHGGRRDWARKLLLRLLFRYAAGALATGSANRDFYRAHGLSARKIYAGVLPADVARFSAAAHRHRSSPAPAARSRPFVIGFAGKFIPRKGIADLVDAVSRLPAAAAWQLWLIGDGPLRGEVEAQVARLGMTANVRFLGFKNTSELPSLMATIDVMVLPSHRDFRPLAVVESMAAGAVAVVSSATGLSGPGDVVQHDKTALIFPAGDVDALATCLRRLLDDPRLRTRLSMAGQARATTCGSEDFALTTAAALLLAAGRAPFQAQQTEQEEFRTGAADVWVP